MRRAYKPVTTREAKAWADAYREGATLSEITKQSGRSSYTVWLHLKRQLGTLRPMSKPTVFDAEAVTLRFAIGVAPKEIAESFGGSLRGTYNVIHRNAALVEAFRAKFPVKDIPAILAAYETQTIEQVGRLFSVSPRLVRMLLDAHGVPLRRRGRPRKLDYAKIQEALDAGFSRRAVARAVGCSHASIRDAISRGALRWSA